MGWETTMTKQGLSLLAGMKGGSFTISAWAGTGTVPPNELQEQTSLLDAKQQLAIIEDAEADNKKFLRLQVVNDTVEARYTLNQLGVFVSIDGGAPILYFIAQNIYGDEIPDKYSVKGFVAEYLATLIFSTGEKIEYDSTVAGVITADALDARLAHFRTQLDTEFKTQLETDLQAYTRTVVSDVEPPPGTCDLWLQPFNASDGWNGIDFGDSINDDKSGTQPVNLFAYLGDTPPADKDILWFQEEK